MDIESWAESNYTKTICEKKLRRESSLERKMKKERKRVGRNGKISNTHKSEKRAGGYGKISSII